MSISTTIDCPAVASDGYVLGESNVDYATARLTATNGKDSQTTIKVGQYYSAIPGSYYLYRGLLKFDCTAIPANATITAAVIKLVCTEDQSDVDFNLRLVALDWSAYDPIVSGNWDAAFDAILAASTEALWRNTSGMSLNTQYTSAALDTTRINAGGYTYYGCISQQDQDNTAPAAYEYVLIGAADHGTSAYRPVLQVTYTTPGRATNIGGRIKTAGGTTPTKRPVNFGVIARDLDNKPHRLTDLVSGLTFSSSMPGGYQTCTFALERGPKEARRDIGWNYILHVRYQGENIWEGRIEDIGPRKSGDEWTTEVTAMGMVSSLHDQPGTAAWANTASEGTPEDIIKYWLTTYCPDIATDQSNINATGATIATGVVDYEANTDAEQVVRDMIKFGYVDGSTYGEMDFGIWELDSSYEGVPYYSKREPVPEYYLRLRDIEDLQFQASMEGYYNRINVLSNAVWLQVEDTDEQDDLGRNGVRFIKTLNVMDFEGMTLGSVAKTQLAERYLAYHKRRVARAEQITLPTDETRIHTRARVPVDPWRVRAGHYVRIMNLWPDSAIFAGELNPERDLFISEVEYDVDSGMLTMTPEHPEDSLERMVARLTRDYKLKT